ncbi:transposase [Rhizobium mongolense]|uniref:Transposase n=2 Tax=Rhizobium mongolense TaxID=57676 RepID=A0ABR6IYG2_9HYPH|nr:transposase [Rhizobium mongolense]TVZ75093.1 transposase [Rhizobium mongolense USDA 1844]
MNIHKNARLTPRGRERIVRQVESGQTPEAVAKAAGVCLRTIRKWIDRYRREGLAGLHDRSSRPHRLRRPTPAAIVETIERLRRQRWTGKQIAAEAGVSPATVSRILRRLGLNKLSALEPEPVRRYEREHPGELIHLDIKKLGRIGSVGHRITGRQTGMVNRHIGIGWEFVHVCIDDASRVAFVQVMPDQRKESAVAFLEAAVAYYASLGVKVQRVMTDNGPCYRSKTTTAQCGVPLDLGIHADRQSRKTRANGRYQLAHGDDFRFRADGHARAGFNNLAGVSPLDHRRCHCR